MNTNRHLGVRVKIFDIKKIIYIIKKIGFKIHWCDMDINDIPQDVFIRSIVEAAHERYGSDRTKVKHVKSMKMIIEIAERLNYNRFSHGFYMFGDYSFRIDSILNTIVIGPSLFGRKKGIQQGIDTELVAAVSDILDELSRVLLRRYYDFDRWAHVEKIPPEWRDLYRYGREFRENVEELPTIHKKHVPFCYDELSEIISHFDACLGHVNPDLLSMYFEFTHLLEGILIACKYQDFNYKEFRTIVNELNELYRFPISSLLYPFLETLRGGDNEFETKEYEDRKVNRIKTIPGSLVKLRKKVYEIGLKPSIADLDIEITKDLNKMSDKKREEIFNLLKSSM